MKKDKLSVKIGSDEEVYWTRVKEQTEKSLVDAKDILKFHEAVLELTIQKLKEAK